MIPPIPDDFEPVDISDERMQQLMQLEIETRRRAFAELNGMELPTTEATISTSGELTVDQPV